MAGLFGIGGGLIIVPVLAMLFAAQGFPAELVMIMSVATSLATIIFTSIFSVLAHHRLNSVLWDKVLTMGPGIMIGAAVGVGGRGSYSRWRITLSVYHLFVSRRRANGFAIKAETRTAATLQRIGFRRGRHNRAAVVTTGNRRRHAHCAFFSPFSNADAQCRSHSQRLRLADSRRSER